MQSLNKESEEINKQANKQTGKKQQKTKNTVNTAGDEKRRIPKRAHSETRVSLGVGWGGVGEGGTRHNSCIFAYMRSHST